MPVLLIDVHTNGIIKKHDKSGLYKAQQIHAHFRLSSNWIQSSKLFKVFNA